MYFYNKIIKIANKLEKIISESEEVDKVFPNYPLDYVPGKKYGRDVLAQIFSNLTGFPYLVSREAYFPLLPGGIDNEMDPASMKIYGPDPITIEEFATKEKNKISSWKEEIVELSFDNLSEETLKFIKIKSLAPGFNERINYQRKKVLKHHKNPLSITPANEPIILKEKNGTYSIVEGWHRALTLLDMLQNKEFGQELNSVPVRAIVGYEQ